MRLSPYFHALRRAYQAELDDLTSDSEGRDVLKRRLAEKRSQMAFLSQMIETSPEMVAVVFHGAFEFDQPAVMEQILGLDPEDFPAWEELGRSVTLAPWARTLAELLLQQTGGGCFMVTAAALEYLQRHPKLASLDADEEGESDDARDAAPSRGAAPDADERDDSDEPPDDAELESNSEDWLEDQGFDRREG
ncbi:MAG: hypothetical protein OHK0048_00120 [Rhodoferax sp.]